ncbi:spore germination protein [Clostridium bovifaecis]|uniref:Spore germination protein n=1 Tax=Clostridium bovifaecis TaxID=2184719 RepID=A0A6I6F377_9CLOT|nr:spore germination protein [Clostridium bovifaecis]
MAKEKTRSSSKENSSSEEPGNKKKPNNDPNNKTAEKIEKEYENLKLTKSLQENIDLFNMTVFNDDDSMIFRVFQNKKSEIKFCIFFIDGMIDNLIANKNIVHPIINSSLKTDIDSNDIPNYLMNEVIDSNSVRLTTSVSKIVESVTYGDTILLVEGSDRALIIDTKGWNTRTISEPQAERVVRGPREGFTESILINLSMVRRRIRNSRLKLKFKKIGVRTKTDMCIAYIEDLADPEIVQGIQKKLDSINIDGVFSTQIISELMSNNLITTFKTVGISERPDVIARKLLEGRVAIFCDGTPMVLTAPHIFMEYFQVNEDYYEDYIFASFNRLIRVLGFFSSISLPSIYIALVNFHQELIPTRLLLSIKQSKQGTPLPSLAEIILLLFTFEIIREAGVRLPSHIGEAVSIVGALVLGQAAVDARIVSAPVVIVTAATGITGLLIPEIIGSTIIIRSIFLILTSVLGIYGYIFGLMMLFIRLVSIKSFGVPYMLNTGVVNKKYIKDTWIRAPWWKLNNRSQPIAKDPVRQDSKVNRKRG